MADTGVFLEQHVLPEEPVRHWICSLPWGVRALLGYDKVLCAEVLSAAIAELARSLKWRAKKLLSLPSVKHLLTGAVAAVQRTDSAMRLNVHFHILYLDGVYVRERTDSDVSLVFHALPTPTRAETADIARRIADRLECILKKHGKSLDEPGDASPTELQLTHPALAACYDAAAQGVTVSGERAGKPTLRLMTGDSEQATASDLPEEPVAEVRGINLYGRQRIDGRDRRQLERLCRYITRPPIAKDRLSTRSDGSLLLEFTSAFGASARRGSPTVYLRGLRPASWTPSTPVQESLEGRQPRPRARTRRFAGAPVRFGASAALSHAQIFRCTLQSFRVPSRSRSTRSRRYRSAPATTSARGSTRAVDRRAG